MNSPHRLLESCAHPEARELLRAAIAERPRPSAMRAAALALGVGAGLSVTSAAGAATTAAVAVAAPSLALVVGKWVALGMFAGLTLAGGANVLSSRIVTSRAAPSLARSNPPPALPVVAKVAAVTQDSAASPPPADDVHAATPASRGAPALLPSPAAAATAQTEHDLPSSALVPDGRNLGREVAQIDAARQAVAAGNARAALNHLDDYAALDRTATLDREAQLLRVDALLLSGSKAAALSLAQAYLAQHPGDPHSARLRALVQAP
jgi:hypothetical protein